MHCRKTVLRHIIPFDEGITLHRALGAVLALAALGHTFAHVCNYRYMVRNTVQLHAWLLTCIVCLPCCISMPLSARLRFPPVLLASHTLGASLLSSFPSSSSSSSSSSPPSPPFLRVTA